MLPSGTCFTARRLEVVAVAGLLWIYFVVCFFSVWWDFVFFFSFSLLRTHTAYCKYEATCLMYLSTSDEAVFFPFLFRAKKPLHTGVGTGCHNLISLSVRLSVCPSVCLSVCLSVCVSVSVCTTFAVFTDCESCTRPISTNPVSMEAGEYGLPRGT